MRESTKPYKETLRAFPHIFARHAFLFVNGIIFSVVVLLFIFGAKDPAIFLGIITLINMAMGIVQDTRSKYSLEKLQLITALTFNRINKDGTEEYVYSEELKKGDKIKIKLGDQVPVDGKIITSVNLEMSSALITGESDSFAKKDEDPVFAGEIVTAGNAVVELESTYSESRVAQMTKTIKEYSATQSPIQKSVSKIINISSAVLTAIIIFVVVRGLSVGDSYIQIVNNIGALASVVIPQGLVVITTLLFAFGAASYSDKHVLFQEINATEKLGRIKNLCMDKTGTLTNNELKLEKLYTWDGNTEEYSRELTALYLAGSGDSSKTVDAIRNIIGKKEFSQKIIKSFPFSSWRQYGGVHFEENNHKSTVFLGPPEIFLKRVGDKSENSWLENITNEHAKKGERVLCIAMSRDQEFVDDINTTNLSVIAVYVLSSGLREGIQDSIKFFQERGIKIRIITGDNPETAVAVACSAGVMDCEKFITGSEMENWSDADYLAKVKNYSIFARIIPEQKVKIIDALKKSGFTAMVGDGANDALAIKKADLGIAMFDGVPATRRLAGVILMNNSFAALPGAVELADSFISNIRILASLFLSQAFIGTLFFVFISIFGYAYPILPLNITVTNYFTIGIPGVLISYWALRPEGIVKPANTESFIRDIVPFSFISSIVSALAMTVIFLMLPMSMRIMDTNMITLVSLIVSGFVFFVSTPKVYLGFISKTKRIHFLGLFIFEIILLYVLTKIPFVVRFFTLREVDIPSDIYKPAIIVALVFVFLQYLITKYFAKDFSKKIELI